MLQVRIYQKGDIYKVCPYVTEHHFTRLLQEDLILKNLSFTCCDEDVVVGCAGLVEVWEGVCEAWIALDQKQIQNMQTVFFILRSLKKALKDLPAGIRRIHAFQNNRVRNHERFLSFLGFEQEAILKGFFPLKADCIVYRRLK